MRLIDGRPRLIFGVESISVDGGISVGCMCLPATEKVPVLFLRKSGWGVRRSWTRVQMVCLREVMERKAPVSYSNHWWGGG